MRITVKRTEEVPDLILTEVDPSSSELLPLSAMDIVNVVRQFKKANRGVISLDISEEQMSIIFDAFTWITSITPVMLTDRMKESWYNNGTLPGFLGLTWYTREE